MGDPGLDFETWDSNLHVFQQRRNQRNRQPHHIKIVPFNPRNPLGRPPLNRISPSLVHRLPRSNVLRNLLIAQRKKSNRSNLRRHLSPRRSDHSNASNHAMRAPREQPQHPRRIPRIHRLPQNHSVHNNRSIRTQHHQFVILSGAQRSRKPALSLPKGICGCTSARPRINSLSLFPRQPHHISNRVLVRPRLLRNMRRSHFKRKPSLGKQFTASRRCRSKNQHIEIMAGVLGAADQTLRPVCIPPGVASPQAIAGVLCASPNRPSGPSRIIPPCPPSRLKR